MHDSNKPLRLKGQGRRIYTKHQSLAHSSFAGTSICSCSILSYAHSIHPSVHRLVHLFRYPSIRAVRAATQTKPHAYQRRQEVSQTPYNISSVHLILHPFIYPSIHPSIRLSIRPSFRLSINYPFSLHPSIHPES